MAKHDPLDDPRIEAFGLLVEAHAEAALAVEAAMGPLDVPLPWLGVLVRLARSPDSRLRMTELARDMTLSTSGLTRLIDRMEEAGLVERQACPSDRRGFHVVLTDAGDVLLARVAPSHLEAVTACVTSHLTSAQLATLTDLLRIVRDGARAARAAVAETRRR